VGLSLGNATGILPARRRPHGTQVQDQRQAGQEFLGRNIALFRQVYVQLDSDEELLCSPTPDVRTTSRTTFQKKDDQTVDSR